MKIANEFTVNAPIEQAWAVLTDLEQVVPLVPGAQMVGWEGEEFLGQIKIKVGPVTSVFSGKARFVDRDDNNHRATISGKARESRGSGNAAATVITQLHQDGARTRVTVDTDLKIVGKLAQFGSGMLQQVSERLIGQFVDALEVELERDAGEPAAAARKEPVSPDETRAQDEAGAQGETRTQKETRAQKEPEPLDLIDLAGPVIGKRIVAMLVLVTVVAAVVAAVRRGRR